MSEQKGIGQLSWEDIKKGVIMAVLSGIALPLLAVFQTPNLDIFTVNWNEVLNLAINGAVMGLSTYLLKNVFTAENGKLFGKV